MKGILHACLLVSLLTCPARAYEADIHYSTTYVLARAAGWPEADALTIASANQGVDENQDTVAALEVDGTPGMAFTNYLTSSLRQAEKNLTFHCFSKTRGHAGEISADVLQVISGHFAKVVDHDDAPRAKTRGLVALGVALHCQQDAHSHVDFGGSCGTYAGSCYGHTHQTLFDQVIFQLLGKHYFNPDHPGVSGAHLLETLQGTARALAARRSSDSMRLTPVGELAVLSNALRTSGLELPDEARRDCNRYIAGKWLFDLLQSSGRMKAGTGAVETLAPEVASACRNASLAMAKVIRIPEPRFPRLDSDGSPHLNPTGSYRMIRGGSFVDSLPGTHAYRTSTISVQVSHWSQILELPLAGG